MSIVPFGFTQTQDTVFWALHRLGQATGYAIARETGIARANVYHALEAIARSGLAKTTGVRPVIYHVARPETCLETLAGTVEGELTAVAQRLGIGADAAARPIAAGGDDPELRSRAAFVSRVLQCIATATQEVLAVVGPWIPEAYAPLSDARVSGAGVRVVSLGRPAPDGSIVRDVPAGELEPYWGGLPVAVVADRRRSVYGILAAGEARGIDSSSPGVVPFLRHLLRRELAGAATPRVTGPAGTLRR